MPVLIHYTNCPVCGSGDINNVLLAKDYTCSNENFVIAECNGCTLRFTQDVPDAASIGTYYKSANYISHTNTSQGLINRLYQSVRKKTLKKKRKLIEKETGIDKGSMLDVGSGTGAFVSEMKKSGWQVTGLEPDVDARSVCKQVYDIELAPISQLFELPPSSFDAITLWHVLEHVHDLTGYLVQLKSLLKQDGKLFVAVPNYTSMDAAFYKEHWAAYDVPRHLYHFSPASMLLLMDKHDLKLLAYKAMWYDSFYVSMLSSKYKNGATNLMASFFNGLRSNSSALQDAKKCSSVIYIIGK